MNFERYIPPIEKQPAEKESMADKVKRLEEQAKNSAPFLIDNNVRKENTSRNIPVVSMEDLRKKAQKEGGVILYHGGLPDDTTIEEIDLDRLGSQQNKEGRTYGGFYLTDESSKNWTEKYANERNGNIHGFLIPDSNRVLEIQDSDIDRLSKEQRTELAKNYDLIKGKDLLGRAQYVLLNKDIVSGLGIEKVDTKQ